MSAATSEPAGFWAFSLGLYAQPAVPPACLVLQDEGGADVNIALYLLYLARRGVAVDAAVLARMEAAIGRWREAVVKPLRGVRRVLKTELAQIGPNSSAALREEVKRLELESERLEHAALDALTAGFAARDTRPAAAIATANLQTYFAVLGKPLPQVAAATLVDAATG